jgi:hypothetical protein
VLTYILKTAKHLPFSDAPSVDKKKMFRIQEDHPPAAAIDTMASSTFETYFTCVKSASI